MKKAIGLGLAEMLAVAFVTLKICGKIGWPWWVVLAPLWGPWAAVAAVWVALWAVYGIALLALSVMRRRRRADMGKE